MRGNATQGIEEQAPEVEAVPGTARCVYGGATGSTGLLIPRYAAGVTPK